MADILLERGAEQTRHEVVAPGAARVVGRRAGPLGAERAVDEPHEVVAQPAEATDARVDGRALGLEPPGVRAAQRARRGAHGVAQRPQVRVQQVHAVVHGGVGPGRLGTRSHLHDLSAVFSVNMRCLR